MKRKIIFFVTLLTIFSLIIVQSCKKESPVKPTDFVAAMPDVPDPVNSGVVPFTGTGQVINLTWAGTATNAITWSVYFGKKSSPGFVATVTSNTYAATITTGGTYYWQVRTIDANKVESDSPVWSFDVNSNPAAPSDPVPALNATGVSRTARVSWVDSDPEGDDLTYDVYLGKVNPPTSIVATGITDTSFAVTAPLSVSTDFYWKIVAHDPFGGISESPVWKFTTTADVITAFEGDYNADEPAEDYSYGVTFVEVTPASISTDNYWNSGWDATFNIDLTGKTYSMPLTVFPGSGNYSAIESGIINLSTGQMTGIYTIWSGTKIVEQGVHTYTKL